MIRITILYPNAPGVRFDHDYYRDRHIPLSLDLLGAAVRSVSVERGVQAAGWPQPPYVALCVFTCDSLEAYQAALFPHLERLQADLANYSSVSPVIQVTEVALETVGPRA